MELVASEIEPHAVLNLLPLATQPALSISSSAPAPPACRPQSRLDQQGKLHRIQECVGGLVFKMRLHYPEQEAVVKTTIVGYQRPGTEKATT